MPVMEGRGWILHGRLCPAAQGASAQMGQDLGCRCSRSQLWLPALLLPDGARIGSGSGDLMPVGGPDQPRCLLTVSGSGQAAACSPAGIALGTHFRSLHLLSPAQSLARQCWGRGAGPAAHRPQPTQGYAAANTTLGSPTGIETLKERAVGLPATPQSPFTSSLRVTNAITSFQVAFLPMSPSASFVPWHRAGRTLARSPWTGDAGWTGEGSRLRLTGVVGHCWGWHWGDTG